MNILYFTQFYKPETMAASFRASENAAIWKKAGNEVTVFTVYPNYPYGKVFDGYNPKLISKDEVDGIRIIRSKINPTKITGTASRLWNHINYFIFGLINIVFNNRRIKSDYDVVLGTTGGVLFALLGYLYAKMNKLPFVFEIRDITYVQMMATGKDASSIGVKLMRRLELFLCRKAKAVVTVTHGFKDVLVEEGISESKISVITNGVDVSAPIYKNAHEGVVLGYFGTLGISQNIRDTFPVFDGVKVKNNELKYIIIGEGAQRNLIKEELKVEKHDGITLLHGMSPTDLEPYYREIDFSVIVLRKNDSFKYTIPSKVFHAMGRGIPVLFFGPDGEAAEIIRQSGAGIALCGNTEENIRRLANFLNQDYVGDCLKQMSENGREYVRMHYSRTDLAETYLQILTSVIN